MSRHRHIRNIDLEEELYSSSDYDASYDEDIDEEKEVHYIQQVIGSDGFGYNTILEALYENDFDSEATIDHLLAGKHLTNVAPIKQSSSTTFESPKEATLEKKQAPKEKPVAKKALADTSKLSLESLSLTSNSKNFEKKALDINEEWKKRLGAPGAKPELAIVVVGHVDAGKSTLLGHLLVDLLKVSSRALSKLQQASDDVGKGSFAYAWILDETEDERNRGVTVDIAQQNFDTPKFHVTVLDAPGHREFVPNMIMGTSQADAAILVVDASPNNFESGFLQGGQTKEHSFLVRSLGVSQLIVAVNKMDSVNWSQARFHEIQVQIEAFLTLQVGFAAKKLIFVPCSGILGANLVKPATDDLFQWYNGPTLIQAVDLLEPPSRAIDLPLRFLVSDVYKSNNNSFYVSGRVAQGAVQVGEPLLLSPFDATGVVKSIEGAGGVSMVCAFAGDTAMLTLASVSTEELGPGLVLCSNRINASPVPLAQDFEARILLFNLNVPVTLGSLVLLHRGASPAEAASITKLVAVIDRTTGEVLKRNPRCLLQNTGALVNLRVPKKIAIDTFQNCRDLGRITLRKGGETIASGIITKLF